MKDDKYCVQNELNLNELYIFLYFMFQDWNNSSINVQIHFLCKFFKIQINILSMDMKFRMSNLKIKHYLENAKCFLFSGH